MKMFNCCCFFSAVFVSYQSIILAELLGIDKLASSFGVLKMSLGVSTFIGAPSAGNMNVLGFVV